MLFYELSDVGFTYPGRKEQAIRNVSLQIGQGEKIALTGLNGSGKSTLAKLMMGILRAQQGAVNLEGKPVGSYTLPQIGSRVGYISQNPNIMFFNTSVLEEISFGLRWRGKSRAETGEIAKRYLRNFGLWEERERMPFNLSEGQKQLVAILSMLVLEPAYLILDEPTKSLDTLRKKQLLKTLEEVAQRGKGIIMISHDREFVQRFAGRKIRMKNGEVVADGT